jgi:hypothetical protein
MRGLTLTQPWASLVAIGAKRIETRSWATDYRGQLAIHAGKGLAGMSEAEMWDMALSEPFRTALARSALMNPGRMPRGEIVAVVEVADCLPTGRLASGLEVPRHCSRTDEIWQLTEWERAFGDYGPGRYGWLLADVRPLPTPIPYRGALGLWAVPAELEQRIVEAL